MQEHTVSVQRALSAERPFSVRPAAEVLKQLYLQVFRGFRRGHNTLKVFTVLQTDRKMKADTFSRTFVWVVKLSSYEDMMNDPVYL